MNSSVKLSIILPAYNHEKYISNTFESILAQSFSDFEVIAVDDGSSDGTWNIIEKYSQIDHRIKAYHQQNMGTSKTQEIALGYASGQWVTFCGSDDTFPNGAFQALMEKAENNDLVIGAHYCCDDCGVRTLVTPPRTCSLVKQLYFTGALWGKMFRKEFLTENAIGFPELLLEEDTVFLSELVLSKPRYAVTKLPVYEYWNHNLGSSSLTRKVDSILFEHRIKGKAMALDNLASAGLVSEWQHYFEMYSQQLIRQLLLMQGDSAVEDAFALFRQFAFKCDWNGRESCFKHLYHVDLSCFEEIDYTSYCRFILHMEPGDYLLDMFKAGRIGCKYIAKYFLAWIELKIKRKMYKWKF